MHQFCAAAIPFDMNKVTFNFGTLEEFQEKYKENLPCEEYEFEFIDGSDSEKFLFESFFEDKGNSITFFDAHNDVEKFFDLLEKYDDLTPENIISIEFLIEEGQEFQEALSNYEDVIVFDGSAEDYARDYIDNSGLLEGLGNLSYYFDYKAFARDMVLEGSIEVIKDGSQEYTVVRC